MNMPIPSIIIEGYRDSDSIKRMLPVMQGTPAQRIIVAFEEDIALKEHLDAVRDTRVTVSYSPDRSGKSRALNRAMAETAGSDIVILVSADVAFDSGVIDLMLERFANPATGVVVPRVVPSNVTTFVTRLARTLWELHDTQLRMLSGVKDNVHGGELLAIRTELLTHLPDDIVNEDAYLCIQALEKGYSVDYCKDALVFNTVPVTLRDLIRQRRRVNFGHFQLARIGKKPKVLSRMIIGDSRRAARILCNFLERYPRDASYLPILAALELFVNALAQFDVLERKDHSRWTMVGREIPLPAENPRQT